MLARMSGWSLLSEGADDTCRREGDESVSAEGHMHVTKAQKNVVAVQGRTCHCLLPTYNSGSLLAG
jgi:hypothetical protein